MAKVSRSLSELQLSIRGRNDVRSGLRGPAGAKAAVACDFRRCLDGR